MRSGRPNMLKAYTQKGFTKNPIGKCDPVLYRLWHPKLASNPPKFRLFSIFSPNPYFLKDAPPPSVNILNGISDSYSVGFTKNAPQIPLSLAPKTMVSGGPLCPPDTIVLGAKDNGIWGVPLPLVAPGQPGRSNSLLFKRNFNENRYFFPSQPLPASPGNQNRYF